MTQGLHAQVALGLQIVKFTETLEDMFVDLAPNRITEYVYELANLFSTFYTECKVSISSLHTPAGLHQNNLLTLLSMSWLCYGEEACCELHEVAGSTDANMDMRES